MSFFVLPKWVRERIDRVRSRFLWSGTAEVGLKYLLVSWDQVCKPKEEGGLGVLDIKAFNITLITKWWWRIISKPDGYLHDSYLQNFLKVKYGPTRGTWHVKPRNSSHTLGVEGYSAHKIHILDRNGLQARERLQNILLAWPVVLSNTPGNSITHIYEFIENKGVW